jgi:hypothetical protein
MSSQVTRRVPAVLYQKGQPPKSYHADLSIGQSWEEVVIHLESSEVGGDMIVWRLDRHHLDLAIYEQPGSSTTQLGFSILTFGPQCIREHGWTQISPLDSPYAVDIWTSLLIEFLAASSYSAL